MALLIGAVAAPVLFNFSGLYAQVYLDRRFPGLSRYGLASATSASGKKYWTLLVGE